MSLRALLTSKLGIAVVGIVAVGGLLGGAVALGVVGAPSVVAVDNAFGEVTNETTVVETDLVVNNPNPVGVQLGDTSIVYTVRMNDVTMATGNKSGVAVATGNSTLAFTTRMDNERIPAWWASHINNGERTVVTIDASVRSGLLGNRTFELEQERQINTSLIEQFNSQETRPVSGPSNPVYSNPVLYVNKTSAEWGAVTEAQTPIKTAFVIYNPQVEPYTLTEVGYEIRMNGILVGEGRTDQPYLIEGKSTETVRTTPTIDNEQLPLWWASHLRANQTTTLRIDFYARLELPTGETVRLPLDALTYERTIETDIFGGGESTPTDSETTPTDSETTPT
ncbi:LEA type 2 family protein, partial [Halosegnis sp.]|uniref:LEA type 2 family protein n=1 Tax=Halosegnis sp. TaxID=2864959 RepID=UPI0035D3FEEE